MELGCLAGALDCALRVGGVVAYILVGTVEDQLRGIVEIDVQPLTVLLLPLGELWGGEAVVPALAVPVVDVFAQGDDLGVVDGLVGKVDQKNVGGWAA